MLKARKPSRMLPADAKRIKGRYVERESCEGYKGRRETDGIATGR